MGAKKGKEQGLGKGKEHVGGEGPFQRKARVLTGENRSRESAFFPAPGLPSRCILNLKHVIF